MLKNKKNDVFREILLVVVLLHYILVLYNISFLMSENSSLFPKICVCGMLVLSLIIDYFLHFFLWTPVRYEEYIEGKSSCLFVWTILLFVWSVVFFMLAHKDFGKIFISGMVLIYIYIAVRYKVGNYVEEAACKYNQLKSDTLSILFLAFAHFLLSGMVIFLINTRFLNVILLLVGAFVVSEFALCYLNINLQEKLFTPLNILLLGGYGLVLGITMLISATNNVYLRIEYVCGLILGWCFLVSKIKVYENRIIREVE